MLVTRLFREQYSSRQMFRLMFRTTPRFSRPVPASTPGCPAPPAPPAPATSLTDRAPEAFLSSCECRYSSVPGRPCRTAQPASVSPHPPLVPRIHPADSVLWVAGHQAPNPARLVAICKIAAGRSPARG